MNISLVVLITVFTLIAMRKFRNVTLKIWQIMSAAALFLIATNQISPVDAVMSINFDVVVFLVGMFIIGEAMRESGYLGYLSCTIFGKVKTVNGLIFMVIFISGFLSALLTNDTIAVVGTPLMIHLSKRNGINPKILLLSLAFGITTGSVMSPIGNPQNLLIALGSSMKSPFIAFAKYLFLPTILNMLFVYLVIRLIYGKFFKNLDVDHTADGLKDVDLAYLSRISMLILIGMIFARIIGTLLGKEFLELSYTSLIAATPVILFSKKRFKIIRSLDWETIMFFVSMFVVMKSVWNSGFFQRYISLINLSSIPHILSVSVIISQFISNVPFVVLFLTFFKNSNDLILSALAAGSTVAGNLTILGAASNVIVVQNAEKNGIHITFGEFFKPGIIITALNVAVYWIYLNLI
jgi:Na+/H+ antiporter NhaD/arsenite permease-like protein